MKGKIWPALAVISFMFLVSCGGGGGGDSAPTGTASVSLADASTTDYKAVYITISQVAAHQVGGDWVVISSPNKTYNLLDLVNGVREDLGVATVASGHYTGMRLVLSSRPDAMPNMYSQAHPYGNYFIDSMGQSHELKVPSGFQTGIEIVGGFDINANETTEIVLDFNAASSIVQAGSSGNCLLKPTIKLMTTTQYSIIQGNAGQAGVLVSAEVYNASAAQQEDRVQVEAATVTDANGNFKLFVEPGNYTEVGYKDAYSPFYSSQRIVTTAGSVVTADFSLTASQTGTLTGGAIDIPGAGQEQYATVSIRQAATVGGNAEQIEVKSFNVANGGTFSTWLPVGNYSAVISTYGKATIVQSFTIAFGLTTALGPISF